MQNFNIQYECLDARNDYHAQMKKGVDPLFMGSWEDTNDNIENTNNHPLNAGIEFDDDPQDLQNIGNAQTLRIKNIAQINQILNETGWNKERLKSDYIFHHFKPNQILSGSDWNAEVSKKSQELLNQCNLYNITKNKEKNKQLHICKFKS